MKRKTAAAILSFCLLLSLSGCSFASFDTKNLMAPPKVNEDQQAIQELLQGDRPDIAFVYPQSGEYRSAVTMVDFTGDGIKDAVGFYSSEAGNSGGVEVQFLIKTENGWESAATFQNSALQVDRVCFGTLSQTGHNLILIGWGSTAGTTGRTAGANAYVYSPGGEITEYSLGTYAELAVTDFDEDGIHEVFTVDKFLPAEEEGDEPTPARAKLFAWVGGSMKEISCADADNSMAGYSSAAFGGLTASLSGVVLDGVKADGSLSTQIFTLEDGKLKNFPEDVNTEEYSNPFLRPSTASILSRDINGDGLLEIPQVSLLPGLPEETMPDATCYQVDWCRLQSSSQYRVVTRTMMNPTENYWFRLPYSLTGGITSYNDTSRRMVTYTEIIEAPDQDGSYLLSEPLFAIRVFTRSAWESRGPTSGYELLATQNDSVYGIQVFTKNKFRLQSISQIKRDFKLLSE
ncbi:MAG: hypothetical protein J1E06_10090 [Acutalibacter sp.]|nr:hypothetical protein [Acutalibacter sp.]